MVGTKIKRERQRGLDTASDSDLHPSLRKLKLADDMFVDLGLDHVDELNGGVANVFLDFVNDDLRDDLSHQSRAVDQGEDKDEGTEGNEGLLLPVGEFSSDRGG